ncbi:hypothetical protein F511_19530 [Dorcoceras hygrometricum]|uniref:Uncharacterized protein n=1 Tax=Dorcoceras hygrometricum TaxID=472368 RepID=A0A2Z7BVR1_9LAMI|nr:hypothetical protein F511_19530 [Dorcoceras hygrometricum]
MSSQGCAVDYSNSMKLMACAPVHTWAHDQLAHQLPPECANLRLALLSVFILCLTALVFYFAHLSLDRYTPELLCAETALAPSWYCSRFGVQLRDKLVCYASGVDVWKRKRFTVLQIRRVICSGIVSYSGIMHCDLRAYRTTLWRCKLLEHPKLEFLQLLVVGVGCSMGRCNQSLLVESFPIAEEGET